MPILVIFNSENGGHMTRIIRNFFIHALAMICVLCAVATVYSQTQEYKEYTIKRGDTLWNISSKEVSDPFLWPKIWKENPEIKNPDLIYPGQTVKIPLRLTQKEVAQPPRPRPETGKVLTPVPLSEAKPQPQPKKEVKTEVIITPIEIKYLVDKDALISSGYLSDIVESKGEIIGAPSERSLLGKGNYAYIRTLNPVSVGKKFYVVRSLGEIKHPKTGAMMGYLIDVLGIAEVVGRESGEIKVKIIASYDGILAGDLLTDFYEIEQPFVIDDPRAPDIQGFILAARKLRFLNGMIDIVYIDKGRRDGLEVGDILGTISNSRYSVPNGFVQVISVKDKTAAAIVRASQKEVFAGDGIGPATESKATSKLASTQSTDESLESAVNLFISQYVRVYESGDIDKFMSFYSTSAIENNSLRYEDIRHAYEKNFRDNRYTYVLKEVQMKKENNHIILTGAYSIKSIEGVAYGRQTRGNITWTLGREDGALKIIRVDYDRV